MRIALLVLLVMKELIISNLLIAALSLLAYFARMDKFPQSVLPIVWIVERANGAPTTLALTALLVRRELIIFLLLRALARPPLA